jgi:hypothetical protein
LIYWLAASPHTETFLLKGAMLFSVWSRHPHRTTKDIDLLGCGKPDPERLVTTFGAVRDVSAPDEGVIFIASTLQAHAI